MISIWKFFWLTLKNTENLAEDFSGSNASTEWHFHLITTTLCFIFYWEYCHIVNKHCFRWLLLLWLLLPNIIKWLEMSWQKQLKGRTQEIRREHSMGILGWSWSINGTGKRLNIRLCWQGPMVGLREGSDTGASAPGGCQDRVWELRESRKCLQMELCRQ